MPRVVLSPTAASPNVVRLLRTETQINEAFAFDDDDEGPADIVLPEKALKAPRAVKIAAFVSDKDLDAESRNQEESPDEDAGFARKRKPAKRKRAVASTDNGAIPKPPSKRKKASGAGTNDLSRSASFTFHDGGDLPDEVEVIDSDEEGLPTSGGAQKRKVRSKSAKSTAREPPLKPLQQAKPSSTASKPPRTLLFPLSYGRNVFALLQGAVVRISALAKQGIDDLGYLQGAYAVYPGGLSLKSPLNAVSLVSKAAASSSGAPTDGFSLAVAATSSLRLGDLYATYARENVLILTSDSLSSLMHGAKALAPGDFSCCPATCSHGGAGSAAALGGGATGTPTPSVFPGMERGALSVDFNAPFAIDLLDDSSTFATPSAAALSLAASSSQRNSQAPSQEIEFSDSDADGEEADYQERRERSQARVVKPRTASSSSAVRPPATNPDDTGTLARFRYRLHACSAQHRALVYVRHGEALTQLGIALNRAWKNRQQSLPQQLLAMSSAARTAKEPVSPKRLKPVVKRSVAGGGNKATSRAAAVARDDDNGTLGDGILPSASVQGSMAQSLGPSSTVAASASQLGSQLPSVEASDANTGAAGSALSQHDRGGVLMTVPMARKPPRAPKSNPAVITTVALPAGQWSTVRR